MSPVQATLPLPSLTALYLYRLHRHLVHLVRALTNFFVRLYYCWLFWEKSLVTVLLRLLSVVKMTSRSGLLT